MRHIFGELGFQKIIVKEVFPQNKRAVRTLERLGFTLESSCRNSEVVKNLVINAMSWVMLESEWETVKQGLEAWLEPSNFDSQGRQMSRLSYSHRKVVL